MKKIILKLAILTNIAFLAQAEELYQRGTYLKKSEQLMAQVLFGAVIDGIHEGARCISEEDKAGRKNNSEIKVQEFKNKYADLSVPFSEKILTHSLLFTLSYMAEEMHGLGACMRVFCDARDQDNGTQYLYLKYKHYLQNALKEVDAGDNAKYHSFIECIKAAKQKKLERWPFVIEILVYIDKELAHQTQG